MNNYGQWQYDHYGNVLPEMPDVTGATTHHMVDDDEAMQQAQQAAVEWCNNQHELQMLSHD